MSHTMRGPAVAAVMAFVLALLLPSGRAFAAATTGPFASDEMIQLRLMNEERAANGLDALALHPMLTDLSRQHSKVMASDSSAGGYCGDKAGTLRHRSPLDTGVTQNWKTLRENVGCDGYGDAAEHVHAAFMDSPGHRANILADNVEYVGVGVYRDTDNVLWTTQIFMMGADWDSSLPPTVRPPTQVLEEGVFASTQSFTDGSADHVLIGRADNFPDSLGGAALAAGRGPVLFTDGIASGQDNPVLNPATREELGRVLRPGGTVYLLGGTAAVSTATEQELRDAGLTVERLAGAERRATALVIANAVIEMQGEPDAILIANGWNWPDAITGGAAAASAGLPVVLISHDRVDDATAAFLDAHPTATRYVLGGAAAVSDRLVAQLGATRIAGASRVTTALSIAETLFDKVTGEIVVARAFGDSEWGLALSWASYAANNNNPQFLVRSGIADRDPELAEFFRAHADDITKVRYGSSVDDALRAEVADLLSGS